jgi:hypothetical protein
MRKRPASCCGGSSTGSAIAQQQQAGESDGDGGKVLEIRGGTWVAMAYDAIASHVYHSPIARYLNTLAE